MLLPDLHIGFSRGRSGGLVFPSLEEFSSFFVIHTVKGFGIIKAKIVVFLELSCFFDAPTDVGNLISGSSAFCKSSLYIWKFSVYVLLKLNLKDFEYYFAAAAAKSLQSCPTLCDPIDSSPLGSPGILQARTLEWVAISFFSA